MSVSAVRLGNYLEQVVRQEPVIATTTYKTMGVRSFGQGAFEATPLLGSKTKYASLRRVAKDDLVYPKLMAWEGAFAIVPDELDRHFVSPEFCTFEISDDRLDVGYLRHLFGWTDFVRKLGSGSTGTNVRRQRLQPTQLLNTLVPLPDVAEQRAIAARLDLVVQRSNSALNLDAGSQSFGSQLPSMVQRIFTRTGLNLVQASSLYVIVNDLVRPGDDPAPASRFVGLEHVEPHTGRRLGASSVENLNGRKFRFAAGDVLYGYLRPYQNKVWVADGNGLCSVEQFVLRPRPGVDPVVLGWSLRARTTLDAVISGTNNLQLPRLGSRQLGDLEIFDAKAATPQLRARLEETSRAVIKADLLSERRRSALKALPQAARNAEFARLLG